jgi:hypothetical protein
MAGELEATLIGVWQQSLVDKKKRVELEGESYAVRLTAKSKLTQLDFRFAGRELRGLEQNPGTKCGGRRWLGRVGR